MVVDVECQAAIVAKQGQFTPLSYPSELASGAMASLDDKSLLEQLDAIAPIKQFDAFPKIPASYKARTKFGGFMTIFVIALSFLLVLNDIGEFIWGWSDYEFAVDRDTYRTLDINVDIIVNSPCGSTYTYMYMQYFSLPNSSQHRLA